MVGLGNWILSLVEPLIVRIMATLGLSVGVFKGLMEFIETFEEYVVSSVKSLPSDILGLFLLAGGGEALSIILSAVSVRLFIAGIKNSTFFFMQNQGS